MEQLLKASDIFDNEELAKFENKKTPISMKYTDTIYLDDYSKEDILNNKYCVKSCYDRKGGNLIFLVIEDQLNNELKHYSLFNKLKTVLCLKNCRVINYKDKTLVKLNLNFNYYMGDNDLQRFIYDTTRIINNKFSITLKSYFKPELLFDRHNGYYYVYLSYTSLFQLITALKKQLQSQLVAITEFFEKHQTFFKIMFNTCTQFVVYQHMLNNLFNDMFHNEANFIRNRLLISNFNNNDNKQSYQTLNNNFRHTIITDNKQIQNIWHKLQPLMNKYHFSIKPRSIFNALTCCNGQLKVAHENNVFSALKGMYHAYFEAKCNHSDAFDYCLSKYPNDTYYWDIGLITQFEDYYYDNALALD